MHYQNWYEKNYPRMVKNGLWLRGGELNTLNLNEYEARPFRALFVRLSTYFDTGYSFTHQLLYQIAAHTPGVFPDLAYLPPKQDLNIFAKENVPWLLGTQTKRGPNSFDLIGFSNSIVQELINIPSVLKMSGIPLKKSERLKRTDLPLVLMGGANALYSSVIGFEEPLVDGVFVGESDAAIRKILEISRDGKAEGLSKQEILNRLEVVPGFFQPDQPKKTRKSFIQNLNQSEALESGPVYFLEEQMGSSHLQISEGCPCFCSFCAESWDRKPYRERGAEPLRETALRAKAAMGLERIDIYSFNFNMHSGFYKIIWDLIPYFRVIGLKSQRFDLLAHDPMMVEFQHAIEKASLTCGLEGISPRLRKYLHKNLENEQLHAALSAIFKSKARELKIFLIATGLEEEQDFEALTDLLDHVKKVRQTYNAGTRIVLSMTPLVRFPWTPLEFENAYSIEHYEKIISKTKSRIEASGLEFRESAELPEYWISQVMVRADSPKIKNALLSAVEKTKYVYYRDVPESFRRVLENELRTEGVDPGACLKGFSLEESFQKPWSSIETGVKREFLWEEVERARSYKEIDYCLGRSWTAAKCFHCGGCPTRFHVKDIVLSQQKRDYSLEDFKNRIKDARQSEVSVEFLIDISDRARGLPRKGVGVDLARALMSASSTLALYYRGYKESFWSQNDEPVWITGLDRVTLSFNKAAIPLLTTLFSNPVFLSHINEKYLKYGHCLGMALENWQPQKLILKSSFPMKLDRYLKPRGLKHTLRKTNEGKYLYELTPQAAKKGIITSIVHSKLSDGIETCEITLGNKFNYDEFLSEAFLFSHPTDRVLVEPHALGNREVLKSIPELLDLSKATSSGLSRHL